jgi:biotin carboxylase
VSLLILHKKNQSRRRHLARACEYASQHGEQLVLMMKDPTWEADFADQVMHVDVANIQQTLAAVSELAVPISAVASFAEAAVPTAAKVSAVLGLPGVSEHTAYIARDKFAMRQAFAAASVCQPGFALAKTPEEARNAARGAGFPLVLKPVLGTGSMCVRSIASQAELETHFAYLQKKSWNNFSSDPLYDTAYRAHDGALLVEEFVPGPEICVESIVVGRETHVIAIHDKPLPTGPTFEEVYACTPTRLPRQVVDRVVETTKAVHAALGIASGATHVEFRLRECTEPVVLEAAARMGGGPIYRSVLLSTGVDLVAAALDLASGRAPDQLRPTGRGPVGFWNIFSERPGRFISAQGLEEARADPRVDEIDIYRQPGEYLDVPPRTIQGHGHLIFSVDAVEQLDDAFRYFLKTVRLETEAA